MKLKLILFFILLFSINAFGQLELPADSQQQEVIQTVGDTKIAIVYHRPNIKGRKVWGDPPATASGAKTLDGSATPSNDLALVTYGHVWRTGANENTTFEISNPVKINGQTLPAGKYGLHSIPGPNEWTIIFSKVNNAWGSFTYDPKDDQLRVTAKPQAAEFQETMSLGLENIKSSSADAVIRWEKIRVPFTIDVGDVNARVLTYLRNQMTALKADDFRTPQQAAGYIYSQKMTANYAEAIGWLNTLLQKKETAGVLALKANMLADSGNKAEAITTAEKAIQLAATMNPKPNTSALEKNLAAWKASK